MYMLTLMAAGPRPSALQRELRQSKPFPGPEQEGAVALLRTADLVRREVERALEPLGITGQQFNVLRILRGARPEPLPTLEIADRMIEHAPGITRLLDRLEARALVKRDRCREDRRRVLCSITAAGLELLRAADGPVHAAERAVVGRLRGPQLGQLLKLLGTVRGVDG
jgi:DNA-binding MarR family transcriptional regulator